MSRLPLELKLILPILLIGVFASALTFVIVPRVLRDAAAADALGDAEQRILAVRAAADLYVRTAASKAQSSGAMVLSEQHRTRPDAIPIRASFYLDLAALSGDAATQMAVWSPYPFDIRRDRRETPESRAAWEALKGAPEGRLRTVSGATAFVALPERLSAQGCVDCHNAHPGRSPAAPAWTVGDVRAVSTATVDLTAAFAQADRLGATVAAAVLGLSVLIAAGAWVYVRRTSRSIVRLAGGLARGEDTTTTADRARRDEVGLLVAAAGKLRGALQASQSQTGRVLAAAERVTAASGEAAQAVDHVSNAMRQHVAAVDEVSSAVGVSIDRIAEISATLQEGIARSQQMSRKVTSSVVGVDGLATAVKEIAELSERIDSVTGTIAALAARSNILALNAAIEAARAGNQGSGFAVVAEEVGKLSEQTSRLAREIAQLSAAARERIGSGVVTASTVTADMDEVQTLIRENDDRARSASAAVDGQLAAARVIERGLEELRQISDATAAASTEIAQTMAALMLVADDARREAQRAQHVAAT
jgi:methyl-accepting chemotaxis protein